jgi:hypothetical protein
MKTLDSCTVLSGMFVAVYAGFLLKITTDPSDKIARAAI